MSDEDRLIHWIARAIRPRLSRSGGEYGLVLGIGDDAAILSSGRGDEWVVSCDAFIEGVHFLAGVHPADSVGYKALVRATSDLVAMGAAPRLFLLTLALPSGRSGKWLDGFLRGMRRAARSLDMVLAGGDTTANKSVNISVTVLGQVKPRRALTRSGARRDDLIYVSGKLGRAELGLELVRRGYVRQRRFATILQPHLYPRVRIELGRWLARNRIPSAMMDLSDGLSSDLTRLCRASNVGARISADRIPAVPLPPGIARLLPHRAIDPLQMALHGGDDYELLFTVPTQGVKRLRAAPGFSDLTCIGEITRDRRVLLVGDDGLATPLRAAGWDPFRK
jgi:thiamine-monophosphate kinase